MQDSVLTSLYAIMKSIKSCVLTINGGSSSIKFALYEIDESLVQLFYGEMESIGTKNTKLSFTNTITNQKNSINIKTNDQEEGANFLIDWLEKQDDFPSVKAIGHRIVHGMKHTEPEQITPELLDELKVISAYDPEHLPGEIKLIEIFRKRYPALIQIACFDTSFHTSMPQVAKLLSIPRCYYAKGIQRYGFHGLSYAFLMEELNRIAGKETAQGKIILAQLGNGASFAAVKDGKSIDTSMGFTPTSALPMGTRTGDLDPGVIVAGKQPEMQWLNMEDAVKHCTTGLGIWKWASNDESNEPDVVMACAGDVPTLETIAAVQILREQLPEIKVRVINVVDLLALQPDSEHPHGLNDKDFDILFTKDKPIIFAFHGYPLLIHRLTYRRTNHGNLHVHGYKGEGTTTTPFDMVVLNDLDRFHLVSDVVDRLPGLGARGAYTKQYLQNKLLDHKSYIEIHGEDMPEILNWKWNAEPTSKKL